MRALLLSLLALAVGTRAYSASEGTRILKYAHAAYCTAAQIKAWSCETCRTVSSFQVDSVISHSSTNGQAFVGYNSRTNEIIVSFRGTVATSIANWISDLNAFRVSWTSACSGCLVHSGFKALYDDLGAGIRLSVSRLRARHRSASLVITGHSLGAALAGVASVDLRLTLGMRASRVITFGQPRTGNSNFAAAMNAGVSSYSRVVHHQDTVVHVPTTWLGYKHTATEIYYSDDSNYKVCNGSGEDSSCSDQFSAPWHWSVSDHLKYLGYPIGSSACH